MQPSCFNVRVPVPERDEVFLMNTLSDAQLVVSREVVDLLDELAASPDSPRALAETETVQVLSEHGFLVADGESDARAVNEFFDSFRDDTTQLRVTVLPTLQCNFACQYCFQADRGDNGRPADRMSMDTAARVAQWLEERLDGIRPRTLVLTFFGGEPLMNLPVLLDLAARARDLTRARGVRLGISLITNGFLLTPDVVDRLVPLGLSSVKVTLDGDRETHDRMRPLRGGQGTFDRIIANIRAAAGRVKVSIGGNFEESSADRYPALLDFLRSQDFSDSLARVHFKPIIGGTGSSLLQANDASKVSCATAAGGGSGVCDGCGLADDLMSFLREETRKRGFETSDGVHMGPCEVYKRHAYTIGPDGSLYACPGFTGQPSLSVGHVDGRQESRRMEAAGRFDRLAAWKQCGDCAFIPVCAGGCSVASHTELGDMNAPTCHKRSFESALVSLARQAASLQHGANHEDHDRQGQDQREAVELLPVGC
jgi:uncharacterized protein